MAFTWRRDESDTFKLFPFSCSNIEGPGIVVMVFSVRPSESTNDQIPGSEESDVTNMKMRFSYATLTWPVRCAGFSPSTSISSHTGFALTIAD
jgi:hypothetical protein